MARAGRAAPWFDADGPQPHGDRPSLLVCDADGSIAGVMNLSQIVMGPFKSAFLGYYAFEPFAGHGLHARGDAARCCASRSTSSRLHRVQANVQPGNEASIALVRGAGFHREGFSPRYLFIRGAWRDHEQWVMLADDDAGCCTKTRPRPADARLPTSGPPDGRKHRLSPGAAAPFGGLLCRSRGGGNPRPMEPEMNDTTWKSSPLSAIREPVSAPDTLSEGPVKFLLVSGPARRRPLGPRRRVLGLDRRSARRIHRRRRRRSGAAASSSAATAAARSVAGTPSASTRTGRARSAWRGAS